MDDRYLQILTQLAVRGINVETEITDTMLKLYTNQPDLPPNAVWDGVEHDIIEMMELMQINQHIKFYKTETRREDVNFKITTTMHVFARITFLGVQYLNEHRLTLSNITLNQSTLESNRIISRNSTIQSRIFRRQTWVLIIASILAFGSLIISAKTYFRDNKIQQLSTHIDKLQQDSIKLENQLPQQLKPHAKTP